MTYDTKVADKLKDSNTWVAWMTFDTRIKEFERLSFRLSNAKIDEGRAIERASKRTPKFVRILI